MELLSCSISIGLVDVIMVVLYEPGVEVSFMINSTIFGQFSKNECSVLMGYLPFV